MLCPQEAILAAAKGEAEEAAGITPADAAEKKRKKKAKREAAEAAAAAGARAHPLDLARAPGGGASALHGPGPGMYDCTSQASPLQIPPSARCRCIREKAEGRIMFNGGKH